MHTKLYLFQVFLTIENEFICICQIYVTMYTQHAHINTGIHGDFTVWILHLRF